MNSSDRPPSALKDARALALLGVAQGLTLFAGLLRWKIIAVLLGPVGAGIVGLLDQIAQVVLQLGSMSLPTVALRYLGIAHHEGTALFGRLYRGFFFAIIAGGTIAAAVATGLFLFQRSIFGRGLESYGLPLALALFAIPLLAAANLTRNALATLGRHRDAAIAMTASAVGVAAAAYFGVRWGGITGLYAATFAASALVVVFLDLVLRRDPRADATGEIVRSISYFFAQPGVLRYSATLCVVGFTVPLSYTILRASVLESLGPAAAGFLAAVLTVATGARSVFTQASTQLLIPRASRAASKAERTAEVDSYLRTLVVAMLIAALPIALFPGEIVRLLFSGKFLPAVLFLGVFVLGELMMAFGDAYRILMLGFDDLAGYLATTVTAPTIVMLGAAFVVARFGILGLGVLHIFAAVFGLIVSQVRLRQRHGTSTTRRVMALYGMMVVLVSAALYLGATVSEASLGTWAWKLTVGLLFAATGIRMLPAAERVALRRFLPELGSKRSP